MARLDEVECWRRLISADHGVLGTVHPERGVDAVPVVFAVDPGERRIYLPIDTVKAKRGGRLQRLANLDADPRCVLLVDHYDTDWTKVWWVRVHGRAAESAPSEPVRDLFRDRYPDYRESGAVTSIIVMAAEAVTGWSAR